MGPAIAKFLQAAISLAKKGVKETDILKAAKQEFGEVSDLLKIQIRRLFKNKDAPSIKNPEKKTGEVVPFKKDQASGIMQTEEASLLMKRLDEGVEALKKMKRPGMDLATGLTRTSVRKILEKNGIQVPDKADPIEVFATNFGADALMDVKNVAEEMLELEQMGKVTKSIDEVLEQEGMFDIKINKDAPQGMSQDELRQIKKEVDREKMLKDFDPTDREPNAMGGMNRINFRIGSLPKGIQALVGLINKKFGKGAVKTADEIDRPKNVQAFEDFETRNPNPKRELTDDEIEDFALEVGELDAYDFDGTVGSRDRILKERKDEYDYMYDQYKMGKLDPEPGDKSEARMNLLRKRAEEMEMSGDKRLLNPDEMDELAELEATYLNNVDEAYGVDTAMRKELNEMKKLGANKLAERFELKQRFPGLDDALIDKILVDDNPQRKAEVLATIEESYKMLEKGMDPGDIIDTFKNTSRRKNAQGGLNYLMGM